VFIGIECPRKFEKFVFTCEALAFVFATNVKNEVIVAELGML
jgi:hypothetical protein